MPERRLPSGSSNRSARSDRSYKTRHLRPSGGYRTLRSFQATTIISDATVAFCERFLNKRSCTVDQMVQAARRGRQTIAEGSRAPATPSQTELQPLPACPSCGKPMVVRPARRGERAGSQFWGCSGYPNCKGTCALGG